MECLKNVDISASNTGQRAIRVINVLIVCRDMLLFSSISCSFLYIEIYVISHFTPMNSDSLARSHDEELYYRDRFLVGPSTRITHLRTLHYLFILN